MSFTSTTATVYLSPSKRRRRSSSPDPNAKKASSIKDIYNWTFYPTAIAPCSIRDVLELRENKLEGRAFFWLGSVPCSSVKIVGLIVGVQVYEKKIIYSVDDGTGVIDCSHMPRQPTLPHQRIELLLPVPIGKVGEFVQVTGRVQDQLWSNSRKISVNDIELCSANDELVHVKAVRVLHRTSYSQTEPFTIPPQTYRPIVNTPKKSDVLDTPSTVYSSPISSISSSPIKPVQAEQIHKSPIKLRHPSRLHTHDLTENTFRIYLKHYMDHAPTFQYPSDAEYDSDVGIGHSIPSTPTKPSRFDETPRQSSSRSEFDATPRARIPALNFGTTISSSSVPAHVTSESQTDTTQRGFSLSYLRRVPELSLLASRVVEAVGRRKQREERQRMKDAGVLPSRSQKSKMVLSSSTIPPDRFAAKKKRLFQWAVIQLLKEGCIVHWDGPVRSCPDTSIMDATRLWKANTTSMTLPYDNTLFSMTSSSIPRPNNDADDGMLSDPDPSEEAYISLSPEFLADFVEKAITVLVNHYEKIGKPYNGATKEGILAVLRKDDRWKYVGEWNVDDTLDLLKRDGRVWCIGKGRWDVTG